MRPRKKKTRVVALSELTDEQLKYATVHFKLHSGTTSTLPASTVNAIQKRLTHGLRQIQGAQGGRPSKAPSDIANQILLKFSDYWLTRSEKEPLLRAHAHARAWIVREVLDTHPGIKLATARRWVSEVIGAKSAMPKNYRRK